MSLLAGLCLIFAMQSQPMSARLRWDWWDCLCWYHYDFFTHCSLPVSETLVQCTHLFCFCRWILIAWGMITVLCGTFIFGQSTFFSIMQVFHKLWFLSSFETLPLNRTLLFSTEWMYPILQNIAGKSMNMLIHVGMSSFYAKFLWCSKLLVIIWNILFRPSVQFCSERLFGKVTYLGLVLPVNIIAIFF